MIKNIDEIPETIRNKEAKKVKCNFQEVMNEGPYNNDIICTTKYYEDNGILCNGEDCIFQKLLAESYGRIKYDLRPRKFSLNKKLVEGKLTSTSDGLKIDNIYLEVLIPNKFWDLNVKVTIEEIA